LPFSSEIKNVLWPHVSASLGHIPTDRSLTDPTEELGHGQSAFTNDRFVVDAGIGFIQTVRSGVITPPALAQGPEHALSLPMTAFCPEVQISAIPSLQRSFVSFLQQNLLIDLFLIADKWR